MKTLVRLRMKLDLLAAIEQLKTDGDNLSDTIRFIIKMEMDHYKPPDIDPRAYVPKARKPAKQISVRLPTYILDRVVSLANRYTVPVPTMILRLLARHIWKNFVKMSGI